MLREKPPRPLPLSEPPLPPLRARGWGYRAGARGRRAVTGPPSALLAARPGAEGGFGAGGRCPRGTAAAPATLRSGHAVSRRGEGAAVAAAEVGGEGWGCEGKALEPPRVRQGGGTGVQREAMGTSSMEAPGGFPRREGAAGAGTWGTRALVASAENCERFSLGGGRFLYRL